MTGALRAAWLVARKDLRVEMRSRELLYTTLFFAVACVLVFAFAFGSPTEETAAGVLWVSVTFSGTVALGRTFERERQSETLRALLLSPVERGAIYLGKLTGLMILMSGIQLVLVPVVGLLFSAPIGRAPMLLAALLVAGTLGFAAVGTLFAAMLSGCTHATSCCRCCCTRSRCRWSSPGCEGTAAIFGERAEPGHG